MITSNYSTVPTETSTETTRSDIRYVTPEDLTGMLAGKKVAPIDGEWDHTPLTDTYEKPNPISFQTCFTLDGERVGLFIGHPDYVWPLVDFPELDRFYILVADPQTNNPYTLGMMTATSDVHLPMFYSPVDPQMFFGETVWHAALQSPKRQATLVPDMVATVSKKRKLNGTVERKGFGKATLIDVSGTCAAGMNLDKFHESVGIQSPYKKLADGHDKGNMGEFARIDPANFIRYAMGDVIFLEQAVINRTSQVNEMVSEALGFAPGYVAPWEKGRRLPMSSGALVSTTFELWLEQHTDYGEALRVLAPYTQYTSTKGNQTFLKTYLVPMLTGTVDKQTVYREDHPLTSLPSRTGWGDQSETLDHFHPLSYGSIPGQIYRHKGQHSTGLLLAIVYGGRCVRENPYGNSWKEVLDIDLSSCYGTALASFKMPLGFRKTLKYACNNTDRTTLGQFLEENGDELVDNAYQIFVSGELPFNQDLLASKLEVDETRILNAVFEDKDDADERDVDRAHLPGKMVHLTRELRHTCLTSDLLRVIKQVCTPQEWKAFKRVTVDAAEWFPKSWLCRTPQQLAERCAKVPHQKFAPDKVTPVEPEAWYQIDLEGFVGRFVSARKKAKKTSTGKGSRGDLLQNAIKLFINTTYGCLASPYFRMGSTMLANNITAKARVGVWMIAKSLGTVQSITDGGAYPYNEVRFITQANGGRKPGMETLSDYNRTIAHRSIHTGSLMGLQFAKLKVELHTGRKPVTDMLETCALGHINSFWSHYGLSLPFNIEHKYENTCDVASFTGSADYLMIGVGSATGHTYEGRRYVFKSRGSKDGPSGMHAKKRYLFDLSRTLKGSLLFPDGQITQQYSVIPKLLQVGEYQKNPAKYDQIGCLPGSQYQQTQAFTPSDKAGLVTTITEWEGREESHRKAIAKHKKTNDGSQFGYAPRQQRQKPLILNRTLDLI